VLRPYPASTPDTAIIQAVRMAAAVSTRVSVIACGVAPKVPRSLFGNAIGNVAGLVGEEKQKSALDVQRLLAKFGDEVAKQGGLTLGDCISEMRPSPEVPAVLADYARLYDLAILPMPEGDYLSQFDAQWYAETIVFGRATRQSSCRMLVECVNRVRSVRSSSPGTRASLPRAPLPMHCLFSARPNRCDC
jgi:hypothetical protein